MFFPPFRPSSSSEQCDDVIVKGFTWKQGFLQDDKSLTIKLLVTAGENVDEEETNQYIAELSNEGRTLTLMRSSQPFLTLELYSTVEAVKNIISLSKNNVNDNNQQTVLEIQLEKKKANDNWPWLLMAPLCASRSRNDYSKFPFFSEDEINKEFLQYEIPALPPPSACSETEKQNEDNKNTNENQEENSLSLPLFYSFSLEHEHQMKERIKQQVRAFEKEFEALEHAKETYKGNDGALTLIENLLSAVKEKRRVRSICPVTVSSVIQTFEIEIKKMLLNLGVEGGKDDDDSISIDEGQIQKMINADDEHSSSIGDQLYEKATADPSSPSSIELLRYAAIKFHHEPSVLLLHQLYSSTEPKHRCPARAAYFILRQALFEEKNNNNDNNNNKNNFLSNRLMSDLVSGGGITENCSSHAPFSAVRLFSLAVFFSQRAVFRGDALSLVRLAQLFSPASSTNDDDDDDNDAWKYFIQKYKDRSDAFLQLALDRGVTQAYLMKTMYHLNESKKKRQEQKEKEEDHHFTLAKQYFQLVRETDINEALRVGTGLFEEDVKY